MATVTKIGSAHNSPTGSAHNSPRGVANPPGSPKSAEEQKTEQVVATALEAVQEINVQLTSTTSTQTASGEEKTGKYSPLSSPGDPKRSEGSVQEMVETELNKTATSTGIVVYKELMIESTKDDSGKTKASKDISNFKIFDSRDPNASKELESSSSEEEEKKTPSSSPKKGQSKEETGKISPSQTEKSTNITAPEEEQMESSSAKEEEEKASPPSLKKSAEKKKSKGDPQSLKKSTEPKVSTGSGIPSLNFTGLMSWMKGAPGDKGDTQKKIGQKKSTDSPQVKGKVRKDKIEREQLYKSAATSSNTATKKKKPTKTETKEEKVTKVKIPKVITKEKVGKKKKHRRRSSSSSSSDTSSN